MKKTTNHMSKLLFALLLTVVMLALILIPSMVVTASADAYTRNESWDTSGSTLHITSVPDLLQFVYLCDHDTTFAGKTVYLDCDLDVNPGWDASVAFSAGTGTGLENSTGTLTLPSYPSTEWTNIGRAKNGATKANQAVPGFRGTFDGQGYTISGIYAIKETATTAATNGHTFCANNQTSFSPSGFGLLFNRIQSGAVVRNLRVTNSICIWNENMGSSEAGFAGLIGGMSGDNTVSNVYCEVNVILRSNAHPSVAWGGIVAWQGGGTISNCVYKGIMATTNGTNSTSYPAQNIGHHIGGIAGEAEGGTMTDCLGIVTFAVQEPHGEMMSSDQTNDTKYDGIANQVVAGHYDTDYGEAIRCYEGAQTSDPGNGWKNVNSLGTYVPGTIADTFFSTVAVTYNVTVSASNASVTVYEAGFTNGTNTNSATVSSGDNFYFQVNPNEGYRVTGVTPSGTYTAFNAVAGVENRYSITGIASDVTVTATVEQINIAVDTPIADYDDEDGEGSTYVIASLADLNTFVTLANTKDLTGKIFKLTADIVVNADFDATDTATWLNTTPANVWTPIADFKGTFDGQGHSISGIFSRYTTSEKPFVKGGMFTKLSGTVKNLIIKNSFFAVDKVSGDNSENNVFGGIAGDGSGAVIQNCYFDIEVFYKTSGARAFGALFGKVTGAGATVSNTVLHGTFGQIKQNGAYNSWVAGSTPTGWIAGHGNNNAISVTDTLVSMRLGVPTSNMTGGTQTLVHWGNNNTTSSGVYFGKQTDAISGWTFDDALASFTPTALTIASPSGAYVARNRVDKSMAWLDSRDTGSYLITSASEFKTFADYAQTKTCAGQTFKLTTDIELNSGWSADVTVVDNVVTFPSAPDYVWSTISEFRGTIDGQGHCISGFYRYATALGDSGNAGGIFLNLYGATIKNLGITNSFFAAQRTGWGSQNQKFGGFTRTVNSGTTTIQNVFFNAEVWFETNAHRTAGMFAAELANSAVLVMEDTVLAGRFGHCQYSGKTIAASTGSSAKGVIAGNANSKSITLDQVLIAAEITLDAVKDTGTKTEKTVHYGPGSVVGIDTVYYGLQETDCPDGWAWDANLLSYTPATTTVKYVRMDVDQPLSKFNETAKIGSSYVIANYQDMLNFAQKINASTGKGAGYIFKLTADIDLNPGWRAKVTVADGKATFPSAPTTTWQMSRFDGTFDGQGHYIAGLYRAASVGNWGKVGGFCDEPYGATIKNVKFINGLVAVYNNSGNARVGTLAGIAHQKDSNTPFTVDNVYIDVNVWVGAWGGQAIGGIIGQPEEKAYISNTTFVGTVGICNPSSSGLAGTTLTAPSSSTSVSVGQAIGDPKATSTSLSNVVLAGSAYYASGSHSGEISGSGVDSRRYLTAGTNVLVGKYATLVAAENAGAITGENEPAYTYQDFGTEGFLVVTSNYNMGLTGMPDGRPTIQSIQDYTGNEYPDSVYTIANAGDLLYAAKLSQSGVTFNGYVLRLTTDVDLNPGWSAHVTIDSESKPTIPVIPTVVFPGFKDFYGTLDGQDYTISGVAMYQLFTAQDNLAFIERLYGKVTNVKFNNSLIYAEATNYNQSDSKIAGIAARIQSASATIENVYVGTEVWVRSGSANRIGGIAGKTENGAHLNNIVFAGVVGTIKFSSEGGTVPSQSTGTSVSQLVADGNWKSALYISNCSMNGVIYADASIDVTRPIFSNINSANVQNPLQAATYTGSAYSNNVSAFNIFPTATVDRNHASYEADTTTKTYYFETITRANFTAYINTLKAAGYTVEQEYNVSDNAYVLLQNGVYTVFASRITSSGYTGEMFRARVYVEPYGRDYNTQKEATAKSTYCAAQLWQVNVDNWYSKSSGGACYVIRLTDGRYIVVDSGFGSKPEYRNLYKILYENNVRDGNPIIAAWFFTHAHEDHVKGFERLIKEGEYKNDLTIEAVYFNFPSHEVVADEGAGDDLSLNATATTQVVATASEGTKVYNRIHTGMSFGFADATVTVLYTHEDAAQSYWNGTTLYENHLNNGNDTSTVLKVTIGGETILFVGDAYIGVENAMVYTYINSVMASKFVTVSHHGYEGLSKTFYSKVGASVALWPMDVVGYTQEETAQPLDYEFTFYYRYNHTHSGNRMWEANQWIKNNSQEVIPAFENACLTLPYTPKTYSGGSKTVNVTSVYNTKSGNTDNWDGAGKGTQDVAINQWYDPDADELYINNRKDLFDFMKAGQKYNFYGKTVILNADISVNPSWSYNGLLDNNFLVDAPDGLSEWKPIKSFAGTFDGQGHTIRNLYIPISVSNGTYNGGFFASVSGGAVIENLIIKNSAMVAKYDVSQGTASTKVGGFIGRIVDNTGEDGPAVLTNLYIDLDVYYQSQGCAALAGLVGTLAQVEYTNPEYDADEAEAQGDNYDVPQKLKRSASFVIQDVVYAGDVVVVAKNGQAGGAIYLASGQQMWGPVGFIGSSVAPMSYEAETVTREITNALFLGTRIHTSSGAQMGAAIVSNHSGFATPVYDENSEENAAGAIVLTDAYGGVQTGEIEGWSMNDDLGTLLPDAVNDMLAAVVKPAVAQQSAEYTLTGTNTKAVDLRFIGVLTDVLDEAELANYSEVGMIITSKRGDQVLFTTEVTTTTVYESLQAGDDIYDMNDAGGFLYAFVIKGVTLNAEVDFYITTFTVDSDTSKPMEERRVNNDEVKFAFDGGLTVNAD